MVSLRNFVSSSKVHSLGSRERNIWISVVNKIETWRMGAGEECHFGKDSTILEHMGPATSSKLYPHFYLTTEQNHGKHQTG